MTDKIAEILQTYEDNREELAAALESAVVNSHVVLKEHMDLPLKDFLIKLARNRIEIAVRYKPEKT